MLKRLYADNYKCMVNFEFVPQPIQLILGANGAGKSSVLDVLLMLRHFITGQDKLDQLVDVSTLTAWDKRTQQTFELDLQGESGLYSYKLVLEHKVETNQCRVRSETLDFQGQPLLKFVDGDVTIYRETHQVGATFHFDWTQSAFVTLSERKDNRLHRWFRDWLAKVQLIRINPFGMTAQSDQEQSRLLPTGTNFASWYRHLIQDSPDLIEEIKQSLTNVWAGFKGLRLETAGTKTKVLKVVLNAGLNGAGTKYELTLEQISDGQRALIVLYTLLHYVKSSTSPLVGIDEADNFVALQEIQPWLVSLCQAVEDHGSQALLISHHPELINYLAPQDAVVLSRPAGGPTRGKPFQTTPGSTLTPAEVISRGWDGE
jgi:predicted ATPase